MRYIGEIEALAAKELLENGCTAQATAALLASRFPEALALEICFALCTVAANLEAPIVRISRTSIATPLAIYRTVSSIAADVCFLQTTQWMQVSAKQLAEHWSSSGDEFFVWAQLLHFIRDTHISRDYKLLVWKILRRLD